MFKAKIALVGPCQAGKTILANFISDYSDNSQLDYHPTVGVRILEFETTIDKYKIDVELWDCSGKEEYETCWPAMTYQCDGVIIIFDPFTYGSDSTLDKFYKCFVLDPGLKENQCVVFANCKENSETDISPPIPSVSMVVTNLEKNPEDIKDAFNNFLRNVLDKLSASREKEELSIIA